MDDLRVAAALRALGRRRRLTQRALAAQADVSQATVSRIERGHIEGVPVGTLRRIFRVVEARTELELRWRGGGLDRLLDEQHALLAGRLATELARRGWTIAVEVTYSRYGERGSIDLLAGESESGCILVAEVKSRLMAMEELLRLHDAKVRLAPLLARDRFGWPARAVGRLLVLPEGTTTRRHMERHAALLDAVYPTRGRETLAWISAPRGPMAGIWVIDVDQGPQPARRSERG